MPSLWWLLLSIIPIICASYNETTLTVDEALLSSIGESELQFYRFNASSSSFSASSAHELHIYITVLGNCDTHLFVSLTGSDNEYPTANRCDKESHKRGAEYLIIQNSEYDASSYVYISIRGLTAGQYTVLHRFMAIQDTNKNYNPLKVLDNIPQFFIINNELNGTYQMYAMIEYELNFTSALNDTKIVSFYLDSYLSNSVFFGCWISVNEPSSWNNLNDISVLYRHIDPSVSALRVSSNDGKAIHCDHMVCYGFDKDGMRHSVNHTNHIYFTIKLDTDESDTKHSALELIINDEIESQSQCNDDCGPHGQYSSEQLPIAHGETMWNTLMSDVNGSVEAEFFRYDYTANGDCNGIQIKIVDIVGSSNVYVSKSSLTSWPSSALYSMKSNDAASSAQTISIANASSSMYHIGVYPAAVSKHSKSVVFTISLTLTQCQKDKIVWTEIDSGIQIGGTLDEESSDYYKYTVPKMGSDVVIRVLPDHGDIDLYVNILNNSNLNHVAPNSNTAKWKDTSSLDSNDTTLSKMIEIRKHDSNNCVQYPCSYGIIVHCGAYHYQEYSTNCEYQIICSSSKSITRLQSSQPLIDIMHKNDERHLYEYDYYALPYAQQDDVTITVTPIHWSDSSESSPHKDVNIYVSKVNPLSAGSGSTDYTISNQDDTNTVIINKSRIGADESLYIAISLSDEYNDNINEDEQFEFSIICYTTQTVQLPLNTPLSRVLFGNSSITFKSVIDIGKDFSVFMVSTNNVTADMYVANVNQNELNPPNHEDPDSYDWLTQLSAHADYLNQMTVNYESPKACQSLTANNIKCEYWITIYNPNQEILKCVILGTTWFHQLSNGESIESQITADDKDHTKRFVLNPQIMLFLSTDANVSYNLVVSASIVVGSVMGLYIGSTPFADDLYSQFEGRDHDFAIGRAIPLDRSYYIAVVGFPGDVFSLTATFMDVSAASASAFLEEGVSTLHILDTKVMATNHSCYIYEHTTLSSVAHLTYTSVIGGDSAIVLIKHLKNDADEAFDLDCENEMLYPSLNYLYDDYYDESGVSDDIVGVLFGPRDFVQFEGMEQGDYLYINVYPKVVLSDINAATGYYMEYRLLVYSLSSSIMLFNGVPITVDIPADTAIYATIPITKKMLNALHNKKHFLDISFTKYSYGQPIIFVSSTNTKPSQTDHDYVLKEDMTNTLSTNGSIYDQHSTFSITIDFRNIKWPSDNNPWSDAAVAALNAYDDDPLANYDFYDDDFEIDEWIAYLYLTIECIEGSNVVIDLQSNYIQEQIVSDLSYGVPMYVQIEQQGAMRYFLLDVGDTNLVIDGGDTSTTGSNDVHNGTLQVSLSIISGSAELYIDGTGENFPLRDDSTSYSMSTRDVADGDINSFKVIDIDLASVVSQTSQHIIIGIEATSQFTECTITAQQLSIAPTLLTMNTPINAELSSKQPYAIYDFVVDLSHNASEISDFYIIANALSGKIGLYVNSPDKYPAIPTTTSDASYFSADLQYAFQVVYISNTKPIKSRSRYVYRCVVGLLDTKSNAKFNIAVNQESRGQSQETQYIADGVPITYILSPNQQQLFKYSLSADVVTITITMSCLFGAPSMYIGFNQVPSMYNGIYNDYNWSTSSWGIDSIVIKNAKSANYNIMIYSGSEMSTQFTLTAVSSQTQHIISNGISIFETVYANDTKHYVFYPTLTMAVNAMNDISISMVSYSGDIDIFISSKNYNNSFQIDSHDSMKSESLKIPINSNTNICDFATLKCNPISISVAPIAFETDKITYSIMMTQNTIAILSDGVSVQSTLDPHSNEKQQLFRFTIDKSAVNTVRVTVSALRANVDASMVVYPTGTALNTSGNIMKPMYDSSETAIMKDVCLNSVSNADAMYSYNADLCVYLIVISCNDSDAFNFNIVATSDQSFVTLQDGVTITDSILTPNSFKYYTFYVNSIDDDAHVALEVDVNPYYGDPDLYIAQNLANNKLVNTTHNWKWRSMRFGEDRIAIMIKNSSNLGVYQIGVYSYSVTQYRLNGWLRQIVSNVNETTEQQAITMYPGQIRYDYSSGAVQCYVFNTDAKADQDDEEMEITINVHEGIVNVYINYDSIPNVTAGESWQQQRSDITMSRSIPAIISIDANKLDGVSRMYCCVEGQHSLHSLYEISIQYRTGLHTLTLNGRPTANTLSSAQYDYYDIDVVDDTMGIYLNIESLSDGIAAPFVYISTATRHPSPNDTQCAFEMELNEYRSRCTMAYTDEADDRLRVILLNELYSIGSVYIAVTMDTEHAHPQEAQQNYQIMASSTLSEIERGKSISDTLIKSNWKYYVYDDSTYGESSSIPIIFTFTLLSGNTRTYITNSHLNARYDTVNDDIVANIDNGNNNYTAMAFAASNSIKISATTNKYYYCAQQETETDLLFDFADACEYYIAVHALSDSQYSVAVHFEDGLNELKNDGTPIHGHLLDEGMTYYYVVLTADADTLQILLTDMDSMIDVDLIMYVNMEPDNDYSYYSSANDYSKPNASNCQYSSANGSLLFNEAVRGTYYISVRGMNDNEHYYSILATTKYIVLIESYPQIINTNYFKLGESNADAGYYFSYDVLKKSKSSSDSIEFDVHSMNSNGYDLFTVYVTNSEIMPSCRVAGKCPNQQVCNAVADGDTPGDTPVCGHFASVNVDNPVILETNSAWHCQYNKSAKLCTYYIGIVINEAYENKVKDTDTLMFDITAKSSSSTSGVLMYDGASMMSSFSDSTNEYNFYVSYLPQNEDNVEISLETCSGDVNLYVSSYNVFPTKLSAQYLSENENKMDIVTINDLNVATSGQSKKVIYIGVRDNDEHSEYNLKVGYALNKYRTQIGFEDLSVSSLHIGTATVTFKLKHIPDDLDPDITTDLFDEHQVTIVGYELYFGDSSNPYTMYTECGLKNMQQWDRCQYQSNHTKSCFIDLGNPSAASGDKYYKRTIYGLQPNKTYYFNVLLESKVQNTYLYTTYYAQSSQVLMFEAMRSPRRDNGNITALEIAFGITIPIMFILLALVYYYYKKHKRVVRDLSVLEMEEIPINKVVKAIGGTKFNQYTNDKKFITKFSKANILRRKGKKWKKGKKERAKAKNYHSLLSSHDSDFSDDDMEDSLTIEIEDDK